VAQGREYLAFYESLGRFYPETSLVHSYRGITSRYLAVIRALKLFAEQGSLLLDAGCNDTLEYFPDEQFKQIIRYVVRNRLPFLVLKIPVSNIGQVWPGHFRSHLMRMGRQEIRKLLAQDYTLLDERRDNSLRSFVRCLLDGDVPVDWRTLWRLSRRFGPVVYFPLFRLRAIDLTNSLVDTVMETAEIKSLIMSQTKGDRIIRFTSSSYHIYRVTYHSAGHAVSFKECFAERI